MADDCCAPNNNTMILSCSGASNLGQLSNQAAVEPAREKFGKMFCLAGIGAHLSGFVQSAKDVPAMVVIDGCPVARAKKILEHAEIPARVSTQIGPNTGAVLPVVGCEIVRRGTVSVAGNSRLDIPDRTSTDECRCEGVQNGCAMVFNGTRGRD